MKTRIYFFWLSMLLFTSIQIVYPQSIRFVSPTEGQVITNTSSNSETTVTINYSVSGYTTVPGIAIAIRIYDQNDNLFAGTTTKSNSNDGSFSYNNSINYTTGSYSLTATLNEASGDGYSYTTKAIVVVDFNVKYTLTVVNNIGTGSINIDGATKTSGAQAYKFIGDGLSLGAVDQLSNGYYYTWNTGNTSPSNWTRKTMTAPSSAIIYGATTRNYTYTVASNDNGATITSDMRRIISITFQNYMVGLGNIGILNVNGTQCNTPSANTVIQGDQITAIAPTQTINGIIYSLASWSNGSTSGTLTLTPSETNAYVANYIGKPDNSTRNLTFGTALNQPITFTWTDNPNSNVNQYQIWRCIISQGVIQNLVQIGTVARGVQNFTDDEYILSKNNLNGVNYDARPYYSIEGTTADPDWEYVPAQIQAKESAKNSNKSFNDEAVENYALEQNTPNPFNPSTIISYQVPNAGFVSLKVYDILGREVSTLVNEVKTQGKYSVRFNAANLTSGVYIYQLKANGFSSIKKMILTK